jgi:hypothetical protein
MKEKDLSIAIGLSRDMLKEIREAYEQGKHWVKIESRKPEQLWEVEWTEEGIKELKKNIGFQEPEVVSKPENKTGKVVRKYANPRIIGVLINDKEYNVLCRESNKFIINMPVEVRWDGARWCIVRHPRFAGKY